MTFIFVLFIIVFAIPVLFTKQRKKTNYQEIQNEEKKEEKVEAEEISYDYKQYSNIKLLHKKTGEIEVLPIDEYLYGVVASEMPASYDIEALKAQAIVARTYTLYQIKNSKGKHIDADMCDDYACCQAWISKEDRLNKWDDEEKNSNWEKIVNCVNSTKGKIITYNGEPIDAFFHSNSGGATETASSVWGGKDFPYLQTVETSGEEGYSSYSSNVEFSKEDLLKTLKQKYKDVEINFEDENSIKILEYTRKWKSKNCKIWKYRNCWNRNKATFWVKIYQLFNTKK